MEKSLQCTIAGIIVKAKSFMNERAREEREREKRRERRGETEGNVFFSSSPLGLRLEILDGFTEDSVLCC